MILDIGVDKKPRGTINLDVWPNPLCNIMGDVQYLPFRDKSIPKVICMAVLEHVDDPRLALSEIERVLAAQGVAKIAVPKEGFNNNSLYYLKFFILNLPFSILPRYIATLFRQMKRVKTRDVRTFHTYFISQNLIKRYFNIRKRVEYGDVLFSILNRGKKAKHFRNKPKINTAHYFICGKRGINVEN